MSSEKQEGIQVIGCGLPRTGTASLQAALHILGYKPCHHMITDVIGAPYTRSLRWLKVWDAPDKAQRQAIIRDIYASGSYRATVDFPPSLFVDDLIEIYPDAKVVLGLRSSPEAWRQSFNNTLDLTRTPWFIFATFLIPIQQLLLFPTAKRWEALNKTRYDAQIYRTNSTDVYLRHNDWVRKVVPKERLLEFESGDGWEPLCTFLGVPIPEQPYPRTNESKDLRKFFYIGATVGMCIWLLVGGACAGLFFILTRSAERIPPEL